MYKINTSNRSGVRHKIVSLTKDCNEQLYIQGPPNTFFFGKSLKKQTTEYLLKFLFLFESTILPVNNGK